MVMILRSKVNRQALWVLFYLIWCNFCYDLLISILHICILRSNVSFYFSLSNFNQIFKRLRALFIGYYTNINRISHRSRQIQAKHYIFRILVTVFLLVNHKLNVFALRYLLRLSWIEFIWSVANAASLALEQDSLTFTAFCRLASNLFKRLVLSQVVEFELHYVRESFGWLVWVNVNAIRWYFHFFQAFFSLSFSKLSYSNEMKTYFL